MRAGHWALLFALAALALLLANANRQLFLLLHQGAAVLPAVLWRLLSMAGEWTVVIAALLLLAAYRPQRLGALLLACMLGIVAAIAFKASFAVPRPPLSLPAGSVTLRDVLPDNGAFPSGHALAAALLAGLLTAGAGWGWQLLAAVGVLLVCLSRIAIGVHWPQDVLCGAALGYGVAALAASLALPAWPAARRSLRALLLLLLVVTGWKLWRGVPNEAYLGYNLLVLGLAVQAWRQTKNGA